MTLILLMWYFKKLLGKLLIERDWSAQECMHILLGCKMFGSTHQFRSLNISSKRMNMVLSPEDRGDDDSDITATTWIDRYEARPLGVLDDVSLLQLFRRYKWKKDHFELCPRTVYVVNVWPAYLPDKSNPVMYEEYCRAKLQLHHPYRNINDLQKDEDGKAWSQNSIYSFLIRTMRR